MHLRIFILRPEVVNRTECLVTSLSLNDSYRECTGTDKEEDRINKTSRSEVRLSK